MATENKLQWVNRKIEEVSSGISQKVDTTSAATLLPEDFNKIRTNLGYSDPYLHINSYQQNGIMKTNQPVWNNWNGAYGDFEIFFDLECVNSAGANPERIIWYSDPNMGSTAGFGVSAYDGVIIILWVGKDAYQIFDSNLYFAAGKRNCLNIARISGDFYFYINGVLISNTNASTVGFGAAYNLRTQWNLSWGQYEFGYSVNPTAFGCNHKIYRHELYNRVLTDAERKNLVKGISPYFGDFTRESYRDISQNAFYAFASYGTTPPVISGNDVIVNMTSGNNLIRIRPFVGRRGIIKEGQKIRLRFTVTEDLDTVNPLSTVGSVVWATEFVNVYTPAGTYDRIYTAGYTNGVVKWDDVVFFFFVNDTSAHTFTLHDLQVEVLGTLCKYEGDSLLQSGRWLDKSGNWNDLHDVNNAGIFSSSKIESITRRIGCTRAGINVPANYGVATPPFYGVNDSLSDVGIGDGLIKQNQILIGDDVHFTCFYPIVVAAGVFPIAEPYVESNGVIRQKLMNKNVTDTYSEWQKGYLIHTMK